MLAQTEPRGWATKVPPVFIKLEQLLAAPADNLALVLSTVAVTGDEEPSIDHGQAQATALWTELEAYLASENWNKFDLNWLTNYAKLLDFAAAHGHVLVPARHPELGPWVKTQRTTYRNGKLSTARIAKLNALGFEWDVLAAAWQAQYAKLKSYHAKFGNVLVPRTNPELGPWVDNQRYAYNNPEKANHKLTAERIAKLNALGFVWRVR